MEPQLEFLDNHTLGQIKQLNADYRTEPTPSGLIGILLYPHQEVVLRALLDVEDKRVVRIEHSRSKFNNYTDKKALLETSAVILSEPFGSGKTFVLLSLILLRPVPKAYPTHCNAGVANEKYMNLTRTHEMHYQHNIVCRFKGPGMLIRPTLIVVGSSVLAQWEQTISRYTKLRYFTVGRVDSLKQFYQMFAEHRLNSYDIILLKNGTVTGTFVLPHEDPKNVPDTRPILGVVAQIVAGRCFSRVIYDDFDTIRIPHNTKTLDALFTVYVSATTKVAGGHNDQYRDRYTPIDILRDRPTLSRIRRDVWLFSNFNLRNRDEFVEMSTAIPRVCKYKYVFDNPNDNYIRLIGAMKNDDADNIAEMLNGDAVATAADVMGIKTDSVSQIFERLLDKKYAVYMKYKYIVETITKTREVIADLPDGDEYGNIQLANIRREIIAKRVPVLAYSSERLVEFIDEMAAKYGAKLEANSLALQRVIDNIHEGMCQICCLPLDGVDAFIVRCCGLIVCDVCGIKGNQIKKHKTPGKNEYDFTGNCGNCKKAINMRTDLIFVDREFDLETLLNARGDEKREPPPQDAVLAEGGVTLNPKLQALMNIINTGTSAGAHPVNMHIPHLLHGTRDVPMLSTDRKVVIFANFNETLKLIETFLIEQKIEYLRLNGTYKEMAAVVEKFRRHGRVLLINSQQHCAGLNLQFASDIVLFHHIIDINVISQTCGRLMRIGRTHNGYIHWLLYKNETALVG